MAFWNRKKGKKPRRVERLRPEGELAWYERLKSRRNLTQLGILVAFFVATLMIIQLPHHPLPYHQGEVMRHDIPARVGFTYVDDRATATARNLAGLRVRTIYRFNAQLIQAARDDLLRLVEAVAAAEKPEDVPAELREAWPGVTEAAFGPLSKALETQVDAEAETDAETDAEEDRLADVKARIQKAVDELASPSTLPWIPAQAYEEERQEVRRGRDLADNLPQGLPKKQLQPPDPAIRVLQGEQTLDIKLDKLIRRPEAAQTRIHNVLQRALSDLLGDEGVVQLASSLAARIDPTLEEAETKTGNERAEARQRVEPVEVEVREGATVVQAGTALTDRDLQRLKQEQGAYREQLGWMRKTAEWMGVALVILSVIVLEGWHAWLFQERLAGSIPRSLVLASLYLVVLGIAKILSQAQFPVELSLGVLTLAAIIVAVAYSQRFALSVVWTLAVLVAVATRADLAWLVTALVGASLATLALKEINNRSKLIKVGGLAGVAFFLVYMGLSVWRHEPLPAVLRGSAYALGSGLAAGFIVLGLLPFIERTFGIVTNISLLELCDVNQPALRRLAIEAPGTYAHSLLIGTLAEAAAEAIGANGLLARVGAYFHDIGKVNKPRYFVENWQQEGGTHERLTPQMSRLIITSHVKDGLEMADRLGLPPVIKRFIVEHHGTTLVEYFYHAAEQRHTEAGGEAPKEEDYRYPGPKPQSPETAVVMLSDAVEGATRSLKEPTAPRIGTVVHEMVMKRLLDGQLDESGLTLSDLHRIEETLTKTLVSVYHGRVPYPSGAEEQPAGERAEGEEQPSGGVEDEATTVREPIGPAEQTEPVGPENPADQTGGGTSAPDTEG